MVNRKKSKNKTARQLASHSYVRAAQRYGICFDDVDQDIVVDKIQGGKCELIERQSRNRTIWRVQHKGVVLGVVYDKRLKSHRDPTSTERPEK